MFSYFTKSKKKDNELSDENIKLLLTLNRSQIEYLLYKLHENNIPIFNKLLKEYLQKPDIIKNKTYSENIKKKKFGLTIDRN